MWTAKHWAIQIYLEGLTHFLKKADRIWKSSSTRLLSIVVGLLWLWSRYRIIGSLCRTSSKSSFWKAGRRFIIRSTGSDYIHLWSICSHSTANEVLQSSDLSKKSSLFWMWNRIGPQHEADLNPCSKENNVCFCNILTFTHLADTFIQSDLQCIQAIHFFVSMCVPWELNPQPFALLTQWSTTEPQERMLDIYASAWDSFFERSLQIPYNSRQFLLRSNQGRIYSNGWQK